MNSYARFHNWNFSKASKKWLVAACSAQNIATVSPTYEVSVEVDNILSTCGVDFAIGNETYLSSDLA